MIFNILKVSGRSLQPIYQDGDYVIVSRLPILFSSPRPGAVIVVDHPVYGRLIKRVERIEAGGARLFVVGENCESVDSRAFGAIPRQWVRAQVILHVGRSKVQ